MKTGNVKNVAAFGKLIGICNDLGASYNPGKDSIKPTALESLLEQAQQSVEAVNLARAAFAMAVNARKESFAGIPTLASRIVRAVSAFETSKENILEVKMYKRKLQSHPKDRKPETATAGNGQNSAPKGVRSSSKLDYDGKMETFGSLIHILQLMPEYKPNEPDLKVEALKILLTDLHAKCEAVNTTGSAYKQACIIRNKVLFGSGGIHPVGTAAKDYIRSIYGVRSESARQLGSIRFKS